MVGAEENAGFVVVGPRTNVTPIGSRRPLRDLVVYELMLDDFTAGYRDGAAPVDAVRNRIDYLVGLGVNAVERSPARRSKRSAGISSGMCVAADRCRSCVSAISRTVSCP